MDFPLEFEATANRMFGVEELYLDILRFGCLRVSDELLIMFFMNSLFNFLILKNLMSTCHWVGSYLLCIITGVGHIFRTEFKIVSFPSSSTEKCYFRSAFIVQKTDYVEQMLTIFLEMGKKWSMLQKICY